MAGFSDTALLAEVDCPYSIWDVFDLHRQVEIARIREREHAAIGVAAAVGSLFQGDALKAYLEPLDELRKRLQGDVVDAREVPTNGAASARKPWTPTVAENERTVRLLNEIGKYRSMPRAPLPS